MSIVRYERADAALIGNGGIERLAGRGATGLDPEASSRRCRGATNGGPSALSSRPAIQARGTDTTSRTRRRPNFNRRLDEWGRTEAGYEKAVAGTLHPNGKANRKG